MFRNSVKTYFSQFFPRATFCLYLIVRFLLFLIAIFGLDYALTLGTSPLLLSIVSAFGIGLGAAISLMPVRALAILLGAGLVFVVLEIVSYLITFFPSSQAILWPFAISLHLNLLAIFFCLALVSTFLSLRTKVWPAIEVVVVVLTVVALFSGHRAFNFETPKLISTIAWSLNLEHLRLIVILGSSLSVAALVYLFLSSQFLYHSVQAALFNKSQLRNARGRFGLSGKMTWAAVMIALLLIVSLSIEAKFKNQSQQLLSGGVGFENKEGGSPLSFQSALGRSNQPTAVLRLENDYKGNPFSPLLYLRESALSYFNGRVLVQADSKFDRDITRSSPNSVYKGVADTELLMRTPITQSLYLMTSHDTSFAIDYPLVINRLINPKPDRFKAAFRAYSMAPAFNLESLRNSPVGDPRWTEEERELYLKTHGDTRYAELAKELTIGIEQPIDKALAIADYLSKKSIYTLTPNHNVAADEDQTAPYLFGDMRGYCVHFAHAMVYMYRSLGIPSRIATGYLTDLSQSKDGHSLLRMSDRHAWSEIFIENVGWIPFDIQPEQVESAADTEVPQDILEELMNMLGRGEELLSEEASKDEKSLEQPISLDLKRAINLVYVALFIVLWAYLIKLYIYFAWKFTPIGDRKIYLGYVASVARCYDFGLLRRFGDTHQEYQQLLANKHALGSTLLAQEVSKRFFSNQTKVSQTQVDVKVELKRQKLALAKFALWRRLLALLSLRSVFQYVFRRHF